MIEMIIRGSFLSLSNMSKYDVYKLYLHLAEKDLSLLIILNHIDENGEIFAFVLRF